MANIKILFCLKLKINNCVYTVWSYSYTVWNKIDVHLKFAKMTFNSGIKLLMFLLIYSKPTLYIVDTYILK